MFAAVWKNRKPELVCGFLCLAVLVGVGHTLIHRALNIDTENATLLGYAIPLSAEVQGQVVRIFVNENEAVRKGQLLCRLEDAPWAARWRQEKSARDALAARWQLAVRDRQRAERVIRGGGIARAAYDRALATERALRSEVAAAGARAQRARQDLARTRIVAPADGVIAFRTARLGMLARPDVPLFGFVDSRARWVLARVRETDLPDLHVGKPVRVELDAAPGREFRGKISSLSPATERPFLAAVPEDPSAGNFTKYVQWHPIRIDVSFRDPEDLRIPVGTSSTVRMSRD